MYKFNLISNMDRKTVMADDEMTIREILENNGFEFATGVTISMDGAPIRPGELDKAVCDFDLNPAQTHFISSAAKRDLAASVTVTGAAVVIHSATDLETLQTLKKYAPEALNLYNEDGEPEFAVGLTKTGKGSINKIGATFSKYVDSDGHPTITIDLPTSEGNGKDWVLENIVPELCSLNEVEEGIGEAMSVVNDKKAAIEGSITVL